MNLKKLAATFALTAMILASFASVCRQMLISCGVDCSQQTMSAIHMAQSDSACAQGAANTCPTSMQDHMVTFSSMYPTVATDAMSTFLVLGVAFFIAWFLTAKDALVDDEKLRAKLRSLRWRLTNSISPNFLVLAFSRGILNSKIYA